MILLTYGLSGNNYKVAIILNLTKRALKKINIKTKIFENHSLSRNQKINTIYCNKN